MPVGPKDTLNQITTTLVPLTISVFRHGIADG